MLSFTVIGTRQQAADESGFPKLVEELIGSKQPRQPARVRREGDEADSVAGVEENRNLREQPAASKLSAGRHIHQARKRVARDYQAANHNRKDRQTKVIGSKLKTRRRFKIIEVFIPFHCELFIVKKIL